MKRSALLGTLVGAVVLAAAACSSGTGTTTGGGGDSSSSGGPSSTAGSTSASSGTGGGPTTGGQVLISEIASGPMAAEFIEIYNPGTTAVDLTHYYLSDNAVYFGIAAGMAWNPPTNNPGTDFLV